MADTDLISKVVSLSKRRGFVFQSSEIYGGLKSAYDYGPLGVELKRNIAAEWWRRMVHEREDVVGLDASIIMHSDVWRASGHVASFTDPLVDCHNCKERFRADKAPKTAIGEEVTFRKGGRKDGETLKAVVSEKGYVCPVCGSPDLSDERQFNGMFRTSIGPVDPMDHLIKSIEGKALGKQELRDLLEKALEPTQIYLRPETAQGIFVQFANVLQSCPMKMPFGIAQQGKAFRNEIVTEKFIFRTCEFEQMELEYFVEPGTEAEWFKYWTETRLSWWQELANSKESFHLRAYPKEELAHYASACSDVEYLFPWGWDELEGVASRTDYDLTHHSAGSKTKLSYFDQQKTDPQTGKMGWRYTPYVIEPSAGLNRAFLTFLLDAYSEETGLDADGQEKTRVVLKLNPRLSPIKVAVLPLLKKDGLPDVARDIVSTFFKAGVSASYDEQQSIGKRYSRHDEVGTPYCLTVDHQTLEDQTVTIRDRDTTKQERIAVDAALEVVRKRIAEA